jgi:hypothetical protein
MQAFDIFGDGSAIGSRGAQADDSVAVVAKQAGAKTIHNRHGLIRILQSKMAFPNANRVVMWRYILRLPSNEEVYRHYARLPIHPEIRLLPQRIPMRFNSILQRLMRLLSTLAYWHPPLAECDWLPSMVFPFLQICGRDSLIAFEITATVLCNWCTEWFHFVPNPPITILSRIEHIAKSNGAEAPLSLAWPVLRSFCGEVATTQAELMILDNVLCARPVFLEYVVAAYAVMRTKVIDEQNVVAFLNKAQQMYLRDIKKTAINDTRFTPLPIGHYPVLVIVQKSPMWRENELGRIRKEAEETKRQMELCEQIARDTAKIDMQRHKWMKEREMLRVVEDEQVREMRRMRRQAMRFAARKDRKAVEAKRKGLAERRIAELAKISEWHTDCQRLRAEMEAGAETTRWMWTNWLELREEAADLEKEEVDAELELIRVNDEAYAEELDAHTRAMNTTAAEEEKSLAEALAVNEKLQRESNERREVLEQERAKQGEPVRAYQEKG